MRPRKSKSLYTDASMVTVSGGEFESHSADVADGAAWQFGIVKGTLLTLTAIAAATLASFGLERLALNDSNFAMLYLLSTVFVAYFTDGYAYAFVASLLSVFTFDFFFLSPRHTVMIHHKGYAITFSIMLLSGLLSATLTGRMKVLKEQAELRELHLRFLNRFIRKLMLAGNPREIAEFAAGETADLLRAPVMVVVAGSGNDPEFRQVAGQHDFGNAEDNAALLAALRSDGEDAPPGDKVHSAGNSLFLPVGAKGEVLGAMGVAFGKGRAIPENAGTFLATVCVQISFALERERLRLRQERDRMEVESERLRSNLLRGISHDLRTPLTAILGSAEAIREHHAALDLPTRLGLVADIIDECEWLTRMVENTLFLTRIDEVGVELNREPHPVEEIVAAAVERCRKRVGQARLRLELPQDFLMVQADATLITQVLINLLDNAFRYTLPGTEVVLRAFVSGSEVVFEVEDKGIGVHPAIMEKLFDRFFKPGNPDIIDGRLKGAGLGLSVCKSVVVAYGGSIAAENGRHGGTIIRFTLPMENT